MSSDAFVTELDGRILVGSVDGNEACEVMVMTGLPPTVVVDAPACPAPGVAVEPVALLAAGLIRSVEVGIHAFGSAVDDADDELSSVLVAVGDDDDDDDERVAELLAPDSAPLADKSPPAELLTSAEGDEPELVGLANDDGTELPCVALATEPVLV